MSTDKTNLNAALDLLADMLLHPSFDKTEYDKMVLDMKGELESNASDPQYIAYSTSDKKMLLYPKGHPLYPESIDERLNDLKTVSLDDLKNFYNNFYGANNGDIAFLGNIDEAAIKSFLEKNLSDFNSKQAYTEIPEKYFDVKGGLENINIPDKKNAVLAGAINIDLKETDPDYVALDIADEMLGGGAFLSSRIPMRLRESEAMSYGAGSYMSAGYKYPSSRWGVYAIFNPAYKNRLDSALRDVISTALQNGFKEDEFKKAVSSWLEGRKTYLGNDENLVWRLASYMSDGKDLNTYSDYENAAKNLTLDQVNAALRKYITLDKITFIYAGDFTKQQP